MSVILQCWWQILVASIAYFALGAIWFNPKVFGTAWAKNHGIVMNEENKKKVNMGALMFKSFLCTLVIVIIICKVCCAGCAVPEGCHALGMIHCIKNGLMIGVAASAAISMTYLYLMKPTNAYLIDCGYHIVGSTLAGIVLHLLGCC